MWFTNAERIAPTSAIELWGQLPGLLPLRRWRDQVCAPQVWSLFICFKKTTKTKPTWQSSILKAPRWMSESAGSGTDAETETILRNTFWWHLCDLKSLTVHMPLFCICPAHSFYSYILWAFWQVAVCKRRRRSCIFYLPSLWCFSKHPELIHRVPETFSIVKNSRFKPSRHLSKPVRHFRQLGPKCLQPSSDCT